MQLCLSHLAFYQREMDAVWVAATDAMRIDWFVLEAEFHLTLVRELFHLFKNWVEHIAVESSVLHIFIFCDSLTVLTEREHAEELLQVNIIHRTFTNLAPRTQIDIETRRTRAATKLGDTLQVTGVSLAQVKNLSCALINHLYLDDAFSALTTLVCHTLTLGIKLCRRKLYLVKNVLLNIVFYTFVLVIALVRHIDMQQCLAGCFQFAILFGTDTKLAQRNLEIKQITRQILRFKKETPLAHTELFTDAILQL